MENTIDVNETNIVKVVSKTCVKLNPNKKVLLRERKRHTASRVASAQGEGYLTWMGGGVPTLDGEKGTYLGVHPPPVLTWLGVPRSTLDRGRGTYLEVPLPHGCGQTDTNEKQYLPVVLRTRAATNNCKCNYGKLNSQNKMELNGICETMLVTYFFYIYSVPNCDIYNGVR